VEGRFDGYDQEGGWLIHEPHDLHPRLGWSVDKSAWWSAMGPEEVADLLVRWAGQGGHL
jgi:hypothetical protein